jgi:hypothetical protein
MAGGHIVAVILHLTFSIIHALFQWPTLLAILVALVVFWIFFLR